MSERGRFPTIRLRRIRGTDALRRMVRETSLTADKLIAPLFVTDGANVTQPIHSMPGISRVSVDRVVSVAEELVGLGISSVILFGVPDAARKDPSGRESYSSAGAVQRAVRALKERIPGLVVITDVCMCEYTSHGHCGILDDEHYLL
ncbi:MAG: porphobilinogen synthase, partial [Gemmatimonadales bacterium]